MAGSHVIQFRYLDYNRCQLGWKIKWRRKESRWGGFPESFIISLLSRRKECHRETETTSPCSSQWGSGVLFSPGLSAQLDEQQQGGKNSWQLKWGKKETLSQHEASLEPTSNLIHGDTSWFRKVRAGCDRQQRDSQGHGGGNLDCYHNKSHRKVEGRGVLWCPSVILPLFPPDLISTLWVLKTFPRIPCSRGSQRVGHDWATHTHTHTHTHMLPKFLLSLANRKYQ